MRKKRIMRCLLRLWVFSVLLLCLLFPGCGRQESASDWQAFQTAPGEGDLCGACRGVLWSASVLFSPAEGTVSFLFSEPAALAGCRIFVCLATGERRLEAEGLTLSLKTAERFADASLWTSVAAIWQESSVLSVTEGESAGETDAAQTAVLRLANGMTVLFDETEKRPRSVLFPETEESGTWEVKFRDWHLTNGGN